MITEQRPDLKLYTLAEFAKIAGVTHRTAWNWTKEKKVKATKIGGVWKITEENVKKFINGEDI